MYICVSVHLTAVTAGNSREKMPYSWRQGACTKYNQLNTDMSRGLANTNSVVTHPHFPKQGREDVACCSTGTNVLKRHWEGSRGQSIFPILKTRCKGSLTVLCNGCHGESSTEDTPFPCFCISPLADIPGAQVTYLHACHAALPFSGDSCPGDTFPSCWIILRQSHQAISRWISFSQGKPAIKLNAEDLTAFACSWMAPELDLPTNLSYFVARLLNKSAPTPLP